LDDRLDEIRAKHSPVAVQYDGDSDDAHTARINPMMSHWIRHTLAMPAMTENLDVTQLLSASTRGDEAPPQSSCRWYTTNCVALAFRPDHPHC